MSKPSYPKVRRRRVFYIPGYDPIHARRYRELYRKEGAEQAAISGYEMALTPRPGGDTFGWYVQSRIEDADVETEFDVLVWSDIVRDSMSVSIGLTYLRMFKTAWTYIGSGTLWRLMRMRKGPVIAALYPLGALILQAVIAGLLWLGLWSGGRSLIGPGIGDVVGAIAGLGAAVALLMWLKSKDNHTLIYYLMHDFIYSAQLNGANPPGLEARMAEFRARIDAALDGDVDEVLVVGHSLGAHLAVSILADLRRAGRGGDGPALALLSLGHVTPMVSFLPDAYRLRADLAYLSRDERVTWVDVTAPGDGCAFALCDPVSVSGVAPPDKRWPLVLSAAFTKTLSPERWKELRWKFFRLHFQYLCAFDRPGVYDYFRITAGPQTLAERFAGRKPSQSRIDHTVSKYTSVAA